MNIVMISNDPKMFDGSSAASRRMVEYGSLFETLHIISYTKSGFKTIDLASNVHVYPTNTFFKPFFFLDGYKLAKQILKGLDSATLTAQDGFSAFLVLWIKMFFGTPFQMQVHTDFMSPHFRRASFKNFLYYLAFRIGLKRADCIRVVSKKIFDSLERLNIKNYKEKTDILPIFVDIEKIKNTQPLFSLREKYPQFESIILMTARLEKEKNIKGAIHVFREVLKVRSRAGLIIVGDGSQKNELFELVRKLGLSKSVIFEGWEHDLIPYYKGADLLLATSWYEGYGISIIEALAAGLPVVSTPVGVAQDAGARVAVHNRIADEILDCLNNQERGELKNYPYQNKEDYLQKFKKALESCGRAQQKT